MKCVEVGSRLSALLDGELNPETVIDIEAHLATCRICSQARHQMSSALEKAQEWRIDDRNIVESVLCRISQDEISSVRQEMQRLRREISSLHQEIADLKSSLDKRDDAPVRERSVLRYPYASAQSVARYTL